MLATYVRVTNLLDRLRADERGVTAVEYGVMAGTIAVGLVAAFTAFYGSLSTFLASITFK